MSGRSRDCRCVHGDLPAVGAFLERQLTIGFVIDDGPRALLLEREIHDAFEKRSVGERASDGRLTPARTARLGGPGSLQQIVREHALSGTGREDRLFVTRAQQPRLDARDRLECVAVRLERRPREDAVDENPECRSACPRFFATSRDDSNPVNQRFKIVDYGVFPLRVLRG